MQKFLFLTGFMGVGKTTVGKALAKRLNVPYVDLDQKIVETSGKRIEQIFSEDGESVFRDLETEALFSLKNSNTSVVSTGGGIVGRAGNRDFMNIHGRVIYLSAEWNTLKQRLMGSCDRPLVNAAQGQDDLRSLYLKRIDLYELAEIKVVTDHRSVQEIVDEISAHSKN